MGRTIKKVMALVTVSLLLLVAACAPTPGAVAPTPEDNVSTPTPEGVTPPSAPGSTSVPGATSVPAPGDNDNFRLLVSDEKNAIGDFESLIVTISGVGVHLAGESGGWLEFTPATEELDLVNLQGENAEEIWSGNITAGQYTKVFVYVSDIDAVLTGGDSAEIKLPSDKLHINTNFSIPEDSPVSFVFDISVVATGNEKSGISYILKPVISQSGQNQKFTEVDSSVRDRDRDREREEEGKFDLELEGDVVPGETVTLLVTFQGEPVEGATVEVNDEEVGITGEDGTISFTIPEDADGLSIEAKLGGREGELELEFQEE